MKRVVLLLAAFGLIALPASASGITYVCNPNINQTTPGVCNLLQTTIAGQYASIFTDANSVIYIQYGSLGSEVAENEQFYNTINYTTYADQLAANESGKNDKTAVASLGGDTNNPVVSGTGVGVTSSLDAALGLQGGFGICTTATNAACGAVTQFNPNGVPVCTVGSANCYNDIITVSTNVPLYYDTGQYQAGEYDFFSAVEHETDEALGTASCLQNGSLAVSTSCNNDNGPSAADLFRYSGPGARSYLGPGGDQAGGTLAYFSINSGVTNIVPYNNFPNGGDYGDFSTNCVHVQDVDGCTSKGGFNITNEGGSEIALLDAVGYNLTAEGQSLSGANAPEPGTIGMLVLGLGVMAFLRVKSQTGAWNDRE